jgi:hypothetical protein
MSKAKKNDVAANEAKAAETKIDKAEREARAKSQKSAKGTTKPMPTADDQTPEENAELEKKLVAMAAAKASKLEEEKKKAEELEASVKALKAKIKAEEKAEREAKAKEKEMALAVRAKKAEEIEKADEEVKKTKEALDAAIKKLKEHAAHEKAVAHRESIGPMPKVRVSGGVRKGNGAVTGKMLKILEVLKDGAVRGSGWIAEATGIDKGKPFPLMEEMGLLNVTVPPEGERGKRFTITEKGREELAKAPKE